MNYNGWLIAIAIASVTWMAESQKSTSTPTTKRQTTRRAERRYHLQDPQMSQSSDNVPTIGEEDYDNGGRNEYADSYKPHPTSHPARAPSSSFDQREALPEQEEDNGGGGRHQTGPTDAGESGQSSQESERRQPYDGQGESDYQHVNTLPGRQGYDYPDYERVPLTAFYCHDQKYSGYYADVETGCQVFHVCDVDGRQDSFLCPRGTVFSQALFVCDWWYNVDCSRAAEHYGLNARLYQVEPSSQYSRGGSDVNGQQTEEYDNTEQSNHINDGANQYDQ